MSFIKKYGIHHRNLPTETQELADRCFANLQADPRHPSLHLKKTGVFWSVRVGLHCRALAKKRTEGLVWFWIGPYDPYKQMID